MVSRTIIKVFSSEGCLSIPSDALYKYFPDYNCAWHISGQANHGTAEVTLMFGLKGGKGGFGSQLKAQGAKMSSKKRSGDYSACRDLSGRKIREAEQAEQISTYLEVLPEIEKEKQIAKARKMNHILKRTSGTRKSRIDKSFLDKHSNDMIEMQRLIFKSLE